MNAGLALKQYLHRQGHGPLPEHQTLIKSIINYDNPWMSPRSIRDKWARKGKDLKDPQWPGRW
jgi:hypothetical protein